MRKFVLTGLFMLTMTVLLAAGNVQAQPYGGWIILDEGDPGYVEVPHDVALNPTDEITLEAWVYLSQQSCESFFGKNYEESYWVGVCGGGLRSYLWGTASSHTMGIIPNNRWTHVAVTFDGNEKRHYINGEMVGSWAESGPLTLSTDPFRIGSDVEWEHTPNGAIDNVRLWNVARTTAQIRSAINEEMPSDTTGLVGVWNMNGGADDFDGHDGSLEGNTAFLTFPVAVGCSTSATSLCLDNRFTAQVEWRTNIDSGMGMVTDCGTDDTGIFYFFDPDNWELMVKVLDGCAITNHKWVFFSATTNVFYRLEVFDVENGVQKIYFNYAGEPSPAVTDTSAFATCP